MKTSDTQIAAQGESRLSTGEREDYHDALAEIERLRSLVRPWMLGESCDLRAENESLRAGLQRVRDLCTTDHENKEAFIARVKASLPNVRDEQRARTEKNT